MQKYEDNLKDSKNVEIVVERTDAFIKADAYHSAYSVFKYTFTVSVIMVAFALLIIFLKMAALVSNLLFILAAALIVILPLIAYFVRLLKTKKVLKAGEKQQKTVINAELINSIRFVKTHKILKIFAEYAFIHTDKYSFITVYEKDLKKIGH